jgi:dTDP-4-dehydrorhamnose 3,5-epimerase
MTMKKLATDIPEVLILEPKVFGDERGFFMETFNAQTFAELVGTTKPFVQDNHSQSCRGVLRGLHYQIGARAQDKLVRVLDGEIFDVAVDIRSGSPTLGKWVGVHLSSQNKRQLWVPAGFAHGFLVLSETADVAYKVTDYYDPKGERSLRWDDSQVGIQWPYEAQPLISAKDQLGKAWQDADKM